jgi:hypothetical protein
MKNEQHVRHRCTHAAVMKSTLHLPKRALCAALPTRSNAVPCYPFGLLCDCVDVETVALRIEQMTH